MKQLLIIPDRNNMQESLMLVKEYGLGFEYNDFFAPAVLEDERMCNEIIDTYQKHSLPKYTTLHGAFFDVLPFSPDERIRAVAKLRIEQSIEIARGMGAKAVVFHTNYVPFLNTEEYRKSWIETNTAFWSGMLEKHLDVSIYLENMFDTTPDMLEILSDNLCGYANFGVCLDVAHAFLSKVEPWEWARSLGRFVKHIHINDNDGVSDLHMAWGKGKMNRERFYECYEQYMNGATVLIETNAMKDKRYSLEILQKEGFLDI